VSLHRSRPVSWGYRIALGRTKLLPGKHFFKTPLGAA
jgi:hypothetical protein